jgi:cobalt-precorrin 5A hydrolase/precorrin-3B C17-methyltransferase
VVAFLSVGATVRLLAPVLAANAAAGTGGKATDPAVVCVDETHRFAISLLSGHLGGANQLAGQVASTLDAQPVVTTATDAAGIPGLDDLGLPVRGDVAGVARAILDGATVQLTLEPPWPLPAFPPNVTTGELHRYAPTGRDPEILVTDRDQPASPGQVILHPPTLVLGVGASSGAPADQLADLVETTLARAGLTQASIRELATIDLKRDEPALVALGQRLGVPIRTFPAATLASHDTPNPSETVQAAVGTPSVAEAAVLAAGADLVVEKRATAACTLAVGRYPARGRLAVIGLGPGARDLMAPRAVAEIRAAAVVIGLDQYLDQVQDLIRPGTVVISNGMGAEAERTRLAIEHAQAGRAVALIGSGDAGIYAMASPALETLAGALAAGGPAIDVVGVPGISAAVAASCLLGAPLGNDHAYISLSDLHTPWETIERRLTAAAAGDFTVALYNPRSRGRTNHLTRALEILGTGRPPSTPVGVVRNACRPGQTVELSTIGELDVTTVDMLTVVIVGASDTRIVADRMVTPRGYRWLS